MIRAAVNPAVILLLSLALGCSTKAPVARPEQISLSEATHLIETGQVATLFQPHVGPVGMHLRDGRRVCFDQPHIDWVINFANDNGHTEKIDAIAVE